MAAVWKYYRSVIMHARDKLLVVIQQHVSGEVLVLAAVLAVGLVFAAIVDDPVIRVVGAVALSGAALLVLVGAMFLWTLAWAPVDLDRQMKSRITDLQEVLKADRDHDQNLATHGRLIEEGRGLIEAVLQGGDDQLSDHRKEAETWIERCCVLLQKASYGREADASKLRFAFGSSGIKEMNWNGAQYSGDRAVLASQVYYAIVELRGMSIMEPWYGHWTKDSEMATEEH